MSYVSIGVLLYGLNMNMTIYRINYSYIRYSVQVMYQNKLFKNVGLFKYASALVFTNHSFLAVFVLDNTRYSIIF